MKYLTVAAIAFALGWTGRSELLRRSRPLRPHRRLVRDAEMLAAVIGPGERYESLTAITTGTGAVVTEYRKRRPAVMPEIRCLSGPVPDDVSSLEER